MNWNYCWAIFGDRVTVMRGIMVWHVKLVTVWMWEKSAGRVHVKQLKPQVYRLKRDSNLMHCKSSHSKLPGSVLVPILLALAWQPQGPKQEGKLRRDIPELPCWSHWSWCHKPTLQQSISTCNPDVTTCKLSKHAGTLHWKSIHMIVQYYICAMLKRCRDFPVDRDCNQRVPSILIIIGHVLQCQVIGSTSDQHHMANWMIDLYHTSQLTMISNSLAC